MYLELNCTTVRYINVHVWFGECHTKILNAAIIIQEFITTEKQVVNNELLIDVAYMQYLQSLNTITKFNSKL